MASPVQTGGGQSSPDATSCEKRFDIETDVEVVQPAGSYSFTYTVGRLSATTGEGGEPAIEITSTAAIGPARYRLPDPFSRFTELMLPLLSIPEVKVTVQTFIPERRAVTRALIVVELLRDALPNPSSLQQLYNGACSVRCRRRQRERRVQESRPEDEQQRPQVHGVDLTPELARQDSQGLPVPSAASNGQNGEFCENIPRETPAARVIGMLPWKDRLCSARLVCRTWREAADAVTPPRSYTARVHKQCHNRSTSTAARHGAGSVPQGTPPGNPSPSPSPSPSPCPSSASTKPLSGDTAPLSGGTNASGGSSRGSGSGGAALLDRDILPSPRWCKENRFMMCSGEDVMGFFGAGMRTLEIIALDKEGEDLCLAATGLKIDVNREGEARIQCQRLHSFLAGVRVLCAEHGISCGADELDERTHRRTAAENVVSPSLGVHASAEVGVAVSAAATTAEASSRLSSTSSDGGADDHDHRWDGWLVFTLAVTLACSEDRPFLCRCALQSVWGEAGLPRTQMIEVLSKAYVALRLVVKASTTGFQAASAVSVAGRWDAAGSYRLRNDLLQCIYALESYFVRFIRTPERTKDDDDVRSNQSPNRSQMSCLTPKLVDLSTLTDEQRLVVNAQLEIGQTLKVVAYAGTEKTVTLRAFAQTHPELKILYVVFNKGVAKAAMNEFPRNTDCRTMHSMAMRGRIHGNVKDNVKPEVYAFLKHQDRTTPCAHAMIVHRTIVKFWQSKDPTVSMEHVQVPRVTLPSPYNTGSRSRKPIKPPTKQWVLARALEVCERMHLSPENAARSGSPIPKTYGSAVKDYQLSEPDWSPMYDVIMVDEAQDIDECQADIISRQTKCRVIVVGDPHQAIYEWRGAKDYLKQAKCFKELRLTQCFRFGTGIARVGNTILFELKREKRPLLGSLKYSDGPARVLFQQPNSEQRGRYAYIARTNAGLIKEAISAIARGDSVAVQDGWIDLKDVRDVCYMMMGKMDRVKNLELKEMGSIAMLKIVLEDTDDEDLKSVGTKLSMVEQLMQDKNKSAEDIFALVNSVNKKLLVTGTPGPLMILTTVHKAKGLEYDTVVLADDFEPLVGGRENLRNSGQNANLLYVAVTRAKRQLFLNPKLAGQLQRFGMWDSLALQGMSSDQALHMSPPPPCHGHGCECADARGVAAEAALDGGNGSGSDGEGVSQAPRLFYAGSGSIKPLCRACVEGEAGEEGNRGKFPYALKLSAPRATI